MKLDSLLKPESVAIVGASANQEKVGHAVLRNLIDGGYTGKIIPVNPTSEKILNIPCCSSIQKCPEKIELSVITVPAVQVKDAVAQSIGVGARAVVVISAGFKESSERGLQWENEIAKLCDDNRVLLLGPRSLGVINTQHKMNASFAKYMPRTGGISVLSESGAVCTAILDWANARKLGLAKVASIGNKAGLGEVDWLRFFAQDEDTKVVVGYLESIRSGDAFIKAAEALASVKPVVIYRSATTQAGMRAAALHTGFKPGEDIAYVAAFRRSGIIRAESLESLFDYATALAMQPLPKGDRVVVVSNGGGPGVGAADALDRSGLQLAQLKTETMVALRKNLPLPTNINNPIDVLGDADTKRYATAVRIAQEDDSVDAMIMILTPHAMTRPTESAKVVADSVRDDKTMLVVVLGSADVMPGREDLVNANLPDYPSPQRAVAALKAMRDYAAWRARPPRIITRFPVNRRRVERLITRQRRTGGFEVSEVRAKEILRAYDFRVPEGIMVADARTAAEAAEKIGYPVAMKMVSPDIIHKSDVGGVKLSLSDPEQIQETFELLMFRLQRYAPRARLEGIYIEKMCPRGLEVVIGMRRDPQFGPMLMFGLGGIFVEVLEDVAFGLAPITADEAAQMLKSTRSYQLLKGARGQSGVDIPSISRGLQRISQLVTDFPQIAEIEINPYTVGLTGGEPMVVDAHMAISEGES